MFINHAPTDFSKEENRQAFSRALADLKLEIEAAKLKASPIINGKEIQTGNKATSLDPASFDINVGQLQLASTEEAAKALASVQKGRADWAATSVQLRSNIIRKVGELLEKNKLRFIALSIREAGKPWKEADAEIAEAIDFCHYYACEMEKLGKRVKTDDVLGENNLLFYCPRGVGVVISPWNFPLAITCGMTVASLVTGNTTILKPSSQTALIGFEFARLILEAGVPDNAFAFLPGPGSTIGEYLVQSKSTDLICFTGSRKTGLGIIESAAVIPAGQNHIKKVIAEMGGKNAIIVDEDADLDEAIKGIIYSAFGYAGQKCSACSRVIAVGDAYEPLLERLCSAASNIITGNPEDSGTFLGPVIDKASFDKITGIIKDAEADCTIAYRGESPAGGYFVPATIFRDVDPDNFIWRNEIFGPVLSCARAKTFKAALAAANDSQYALTGGLFSRSPANIMQATEQFMVGNLYVNRSCTGAIVRRQPFGGFKLSGIGSKAGGPDYLGQFMLQRVVCENTMRRGFTPELS